MLKRLIIFLICYITIPVAYAAGTSDIHIKINPHSTQSRYYLCIPDLGCLSLKAAHKGKIFKIMRPVDMNTLFVTDLANGEIYNQGLPASCNKLVKPGHSITIYGDLQTVKGRVKVKNLHCSVV